jgi:glycosyltransferase involved in cell wall biosynthesis
VASVEVLQHDFVSEAVAREGAVIRAHCNGRAPASISVLIPAHNESAYLPRSLQSLLNQSLTQVMRVIVIDNGSHDGTAEVAAQWLPRFEAAGHEMFVLQLPHGNKPAALNAGDAAAVPDRSRVYLDADVELSPGCIARVADVLTEASPASAEGSTVWMCCPRMRVGPSKSWATRTYARVWTGLPWVNDDAIGGGFYAVSAQGRRRWDRFPDIIAEDVFVQSQFLKHERRVLPDQHFLIYLPDGVSDLIHVRTRWVRGNRELSRLKDGEWGRAAFPFRRRIALLLQTPALWLGLPLYFFVNLSALSRARRRDRVGTAMWERGRPHPDPTLSTDSTLAPISPGK